MQKTQSTGTAVFAVLAFLLLAQPATASGDSAAGAERYAVCTACHGHDGGGNEVLGAPRIQGLADWYLIRQLNNFKAGIRGGNVKDFFGRQMQAMSMTLPDEQAVADVVAYIDTLAAEKPRATIKADAARGRAAYAPCAACHGAAGEGNKALNAPRLAGLADWYVANQLNKFKAGLRGTHDGDSYGAQMRQMAMILTTDDAVNNVAAYIATF